jgi:hypothetical protein
MIAPPVDLARWPRRKWFHVLVAIFAFQIGAILLLSQRAPLQRTPPEVRSAIRLAAGARSADQLARLPTLSDPTVFALPSWHGFSRDAWLAFARPEFRLTDWSEPPQWLALDTNDLGGGLHRFILSNTMPALLIADKPLPRLRREELSVHNPPVEPRSELEVTGELGGWILSERPRLPSWPHTDLLTNTVVRLLVDSRGYNVAATLLAGSGLAEVDEFALRAAKAARFRPPSRLEGRAAHVASGRLVFKWHTVPATNITSAAAAAAP